MLGVFGRESRKGGDDKEDPFNPFKHIKQNTEDVNFAR